jgi:HlyD family secretion protein
MKRVFALALAGVVVLATSASLAKERKIRPPAVPGGEAVTVVKARNACFSETLGVAGVLLPRAEILVRPEQEGLQISQVLVDIGDRVKSGQTLAQLSRPEGQPGAAGTPTLVQAPVAGVILRRAAIVGTMASARAEPLFVLVAQGDLEVSAEVSAKDLARVTPGQVAKVKIIGVGELPGWVRFVSNAVDPATQQGEVRVFVGANPALRVGTFARATLTLGQSCGIVIPLSAVLYGAEGAVVQVVRDQHIETHVVKVGLASEGKVQISKGLAEGDMVVVRAGAFLRDGDPVRAVPTEEATASK